VTHRDGKKRLFRGLKSGLALQFELEKGKKLNFAGTCKRNILFLLEFMF